MKSKEILNLQNGRVYVEETVIEGKTYYQALHKNGFEYCEMWGNKEEVLAIARNVIKDKRYRYAEAGQKS